MPCLTMYDDDGKPCGHVRVSGRAARPCSFCKKRPGELLCDFPVGKRQTCDARMCERCATNISSDVSSHFLETVDYCPNHKGQKPPQASLFAEVTLD